MFIFQAEQKLLKQLQKLLELFKFQVKTFEQTRSFE